MKTHGRVVTSDKDKKEPKNTDSVSWITVGLSNLAAHKLCELGPKISLAHFYACDFSFDSTREIIEFTLFMPFVLHFYSH